MICVSCVCLQFFCGHSMSCEWLVYVLDVLRILCMSCVCLRCFAYLVYVFSFFVGIVCLVSLVYVLCMSRVCL